MRSHPHDMALSGGRAARVGLIISSRYVNKHLVVDETWCLYGRCCIRSSESTLVPMLLLQLPPCADDDDEEDDDDDVTTAGKAVKPPVVRKNASATLPW